MTTDETYLRRAIQRAAQARAAGNHPFGAVLVQGRVVLLEAENTVTTDNDETAHAEMNLVRAALRQFTPEQLAECTLYASTEPCAMCSGAIYIAGVGRVVYGYPGAELAALTGWQRATDCRALFNTAAQPIEVVGPLLAAEAAAVHLGFWTGD